MPETMRRVSGMVAGLHPAKASSKPPNRDGHACTTSASESRHHYETDLFNLQWDGVVRRSVEYGFKDLAAHYLGCYMTRGI